MVLVADLDWLCRLLKSEVARQSIAEPNSNFVTRWPSGMQLPVVTGIIIESEQFREVI